MNKNRSLCKLSMAYGVLSDSSWIEAREADVGFTVTLWVEEVFPKPEIIGRVKEHYSWRAFCNFLMKLCDSALAVQPNERDSWRSIDVAGEKGLAADCLRIAWANANDQDDVLNWLLSLDDEAFRFIDRNFRIIEMPGDYDLLDEVVNLTQSTGSGINIFEVLQSAGLAHSLDAVRELVDVLEGRQSEKQEKKECIRQASFALFRARIDKISAQFSDER